MQQGTKRKLIKAISVLQISKDYGFHPNTIYSWISMGLPHYRKGKGSKIFISVTELHKFLNTHYRGGPSRMEGLSIRRKNNDAKTPS